MPDSLTPDKKAAGLQTLLLARALPAKALDALEDRLRVWQSFAEQEGMTHDETMEGAMKITQKAVMEDALDWAYRHLSAQPPGTGMKAKEILYRYQRYRLGLDVTVNADGVVTMGGTDA
jgi:hypothetical protein